MTRLIYDVELPRMYSKRGTKNREIIEEFVSSGRDIAQVVYGEDDYSKPKSCANSLYQSLKKMHCNTVKIGLYSDKVYLIRTVPVEDKTKPELNGGFKFD